MKTLFKAFMILSVLGLFLTNCKKKTVTGPTGPQGTQGVKGNANVTNTTFTVSSWTAVSYAYGSNYLSVPSLDSTVFVSGLVLAYYQESGAFHALPYTDGVYTVEPEFGLNYMRLYIYRNDHAAFTDPSGSAAIFRIVTIPPAVKLQHPEIDYNNYGEVKSAFNLKD